MENRYQQPFEVTDDILASNQQRLANYLIDYAAQIAFGALIGTVIGLTAFFGENPVLSVIGNMTKIQEYIFGYVIALIYYNVTEIFLGRSIGKFITKTIIVLEDGTRPDYKTILMRTICRFIPFNPLSFLGTPSRGWHDKLSNTYVVKKQLFEEKREMFYSLDELGKTEEV